MKKTIFTLILSLVLVITITGCNSEQKEKLEKEKFMAGYTLDDGRVIFFSFDVPYMRNDEDSLGWAFTQNEITLDEFLERLDYVETLRDGGSKLYKYNKVNEEFGLDDFYVVSCNSVDNIKDIYVAKEKESLDGLCNLKIDDLDGVSMVIKEGTTHYITAEFTI